MASSVWDAECLVSCREVFWQMHWCTALVSFILVSQIVDFIQDGWYYLISVDDFIPVRPVCYKIGTYVNILTELDGFYVRFSDTAYVYQKFKSI